MKKTIFIKNAVILTASSLILRFVGIIFKVWLAQKIGSEGIGLYQIVFSVYVLAATFATSGVSTAVTRLIAEELALGSKKGVLKILKRALQITLFIALISVAILYFGAEFIAKFLLEDPRAIPALKILPISLPFMGITSCVRGYFIAKRNVTPNAATQILEQAVRIGLVLVLVNIFADRGLSLCCFAVMLGDTAAEAVGCISLFGVYLKDRKRLNGLNGRPRPPYGIVRRILHISVPITSGRYLNSLLRTAENILVPKNLAKYPLSGERSLSQFGMIKGMALPILFFPSTILNSVSTLLVPEMSEAAAKNQQGIVKKATENILKLTSFIGFIFGAIFFVAGNKIGVLIYKDINVGLLLRALSPIVPLMYLDSISDGILKGLDQQVFSFRTAISDSVLRIIFILIVLPKSGIVGFIVIMYFSNFLTCFLNVGRLIKVSGAKLKILSEILLPLLSAVSVSVVADTLVSLIPNISNLVYIILLCAVSLSCYLGLLIFLGILTVNELKTAINRGK